MTPEERKQYNKDYRAAGFGRLADKRYRKRHAEQIRERDRARKKARRDAFRP